MKKPAAASLQRPPSSSCFALNALCCFIFFASVYVLHDQEMPLDLPTLAILVGVALLPQVVRDLYLQNRIGAYKPIRAVNPTRVLLKITGLYATFAFVAFLYWLLPEYGGTFYGQYYDILTDALPWLMGLAIPYFLWFDRCQPQPEDGMWQMGNLVCLRFKAVDLRYIGEHLKAWIVKAFFLPLMITYAIGNMQSFFDADPSSGFFLHIYDFSYHFIFTIDLLFATFGYIMTFRVLNTQIFSAEPTVLGWAVCLAGYMPFWEGLLYPRYFNYDDSISWVEFTGGNYNFMCFWGGCILVLIALYTLSTIAFGYRFSNLTYRGIITGGTYRFTKHPAYVFKNLSWWLISVPFLSDAAWTDAIRHSILLFGVNTIYFLRARTEENHLSNYPEYVAYAEWMNEHSIFRWFGKKIPYLRYSRERALASGSRVYAPFAAVPVTEQARPKGA